MSHTTPEPEVGPSRELSTESNDDEVLPEFFSLWLQMMKIESVVPYYSGGPSFRKFGDWKKKMVGSF